MSLFVELMIGGWTTAFAMIAFFALRESGKLLKIRKRMTLWLDPAVSQAVRAPQGGLQPERENAV